MHGRKPSEMMNSWKLTHAQPPQSRNVNNNNFIRTPPLTPIAPEALGFASPTPAFKIEPLMESRQAFVELYNNSVQRGQKIPIVPRNAATGWPLLQVGLLAPSEEDKNKYICAIGGRDCKFTYFGLYFLAVLLSQVESQHIVDQTLSYQPSRTFSIRLKNPPIFIGVAPTVMKLVSATLQISDQNVSELLNNLEAIDKFVSDGRLSLFGIMSAGIAEDVFSEQEIRSMLLPDRAMFYDGQIYLDLGVLLEKSNVSREVIDTFKYLFKVDDFKTALANKPIRVDVENLDYYYGKISNEQATAILQQAHVPINSYFVRLSPSQGKYCVCIKTKTGVQDFIIGKAEEITKSFAAYLQEKGYDDVKPLCINVENLDYYYGKIGNDEAKKILQQAHVPVNSYLVRLSPSLGKYCVCIKTKTGVEDFIVGKAEEITKSFAAFLQEKGYDDVKPLIKNQLPELRSDLSSQPTQPVTTTSAMGLFTSPQNTANIVFGSISSHEAQAILQSHLSKNFLPPGELIYCIHEGAGNNLIVDYILNDSNNRLSFGSLTSYNAANANLQGIVEYISQCFANFTTTRLNPAAQECSKAASFSNWTAEQADQYYNRKGLHTHPSISHK